MEHHLEAFDGLDLSSESLYCLLLDLAVVGPRPLYLKAGGRRMPDWIIRKERVDLSAYVRSRIPEGEGS